MLDIMDKALDSFSDKAVSFADIRLEDRNATNLYVTNGSLRSFNRRSTAGAVARTLVGECWGTASSSRHLSEKEFLGLLEKAAKMAKACSKHSRKDIDLSEIEGIERTVHQQVEEDPGDVSTEEKIELLMNLDKAQKLNDKIVNTNSVYGDARRIYKLVNTAGSKLEWDESRIRVVTQAVAREGSNVQFDFDVVDGTAGFELARSVDPEAFGSKTAKGAIELLSAEKPPSGKLTTVIDGNIAGLIVHEVCGHASEADEVVKGRSFLTGLVGKTIGTELVSMVDDGTLKGPSGSVPYDSEGTPSSRNVIIENGVFKGYLHTLETAILMGVQPTGNGRAQDFNRRVFARMTNTFFDKGDWKDEEIVEDTKEGLFITKFTSGMEDVVGGGVQGTALKGYIIKNGQKTQLVRQLSIAGKVLELLKTVDAVGDTLSFSGGTCGKGEEDFIPVSSGGPNMRVELIVGGG
ncbi:MAG: TldD/PmbA family protein [Candidatus Thorarchaeota archaeon]|nr:TldD/PmbA family protein [Candidatus Thorarchaeota archaeon]